MSAILTSYVDRFCDGVDLDVSDASAFLDSMIATEDRDLLKELLTAWHAKGIAADEIFALAQLLRDRCVRVNCQTRTADIVGTGGSGAKTFNVSTAAAFVAAGAGLPVAKHGNKAATSSTGSSDVLEALGIVAAQPAVAEEHLKKHGICFMFAPHHHRLSPVLAAARRDVRFPTIFNCVGPLCNPAQARYQLIGAWSRSTQRKLAAALARLGTGRSWVVHAESGLDEISVTGKTNVVEVVGHQASEFTIVPADLGLETVSGGLPVVGSAAESASLITSVLDGRTRGPARVLVAANAAAAIVLAGLANDLQAAMAMAFESIDTGMAAGKLAALASY